MARLNTRGLIIVPSYHEERNILHVIEGLKEKAQGFDILIIDDGSKDRTGEIAVNNGTRVLRHPFNMGYGVAVQTGYKYAVKHRYDLVVQIDGDDQHDPSYITPLLEALKESKADMVIGSRFLRQEGSDVPFQRRMGIKFFSLIASAVIGQRVTDSTSGFQALNRRVFTFFSTMDNFPYDYPDADLIITLCAHGFKFKEVPVVMHNRLHGRSMTAGWNSLLYVTKMLISILITLMRRKKMKKLCAESR